MKRTLVIHPDDRSTDMLKVVYEGKGFDVINDVNTTDEQIVDAIKSHDRIIMLGHGTALGLLCGNGENRFARYIIDDSHADLLRTKETYSMWCFSEDFFAFHDIPGFHSGMIISEKGEAEMLGFEAESDEQVAEFLMPLMHAMHDTIDMDDPYEMRNIILDRYNSDDPITQYNRENIIVL